MIGETVSVTINAVPYTLNRINQDNYAAEYFMRDATQEVTLRIRHQNESVKPGNVAFERHQIDLSRKVYATATTEEKSYQAYTVIRLPKGGDPDAAEQLTTALCGFQSAGTLDKIVGWQS